MFEFIINKGRFTVSGSVKSRVVNAFSGTPLADRREREREREREGGGGLQSPYRLLRGKQKPCTLLDMGKWQAPVNKIRDSSYFIVHWTGSTCTSVSVGLQCLIGFLSVKASGI